MKDEYFHASYFILHNFPSSRLPPVLRAPDIGLTSYVSRLTSYVLRLTALSPAHLNFTDFKNIQHIFHIPNEYRQIRLGQVPLVILDHQPHATAQQIVTR